MGSHWFSKNNVLSEPNNSNRFRRAFLTGYIKESAKFAAGAQMKRKPIYVGSAELPENG